MAKQYKSGNGGGYVQSLNVTLNSVVAGNLIIVAVGHSTSMSVSDDKSNSYTLIDSGSGNGGATFNVYYAIAGSSGNTKITLTPSTWDDLVYVISEHENVDTLDVYKSNKETGWNTSHSSGNTSTPSESSGLVIGAYVGDSKATYSSSNSTIIGQSNGSDDYISIVASEKALSSKTAQTTTFSSGGTYTTGMAFTGIFISGSTPSAPKGVRVWNGTSWEEKPVKVWTGNVWETKPVKTWNGSNWI